MAERLYDVYELVDYTGEVHYIYTTHDEEGRSNIRRLNARTFRIVDGCESLNLGMAQTRTWEKSNGEELPDLLEE